MGLVSFISLTSLQAHDSVLMNRLTINALEAQQGGLRDALLPGETATQDPSCMDTSQQQYKLPLDQHILINRTAQQLWVR